MNEIYYQACVLGRKETANRLELLHNKRVNGLALEDILIEKRRNSLADCALEVVGSGAVNRGRSTKVESSAIGSRIKRLLSNGLKDVGQLCNNGAVALKHQ